ncbi:ribose 5-phosphate isomerase B [Mycoplasmoides alvi]|uniref:ribose 5-phosphate isomerase B n=1 Tax=Mycoplasmoides alvi TaxID=78580 RepID=UPI0006969B51|nr:ribose 5-phosphate isomerase B [Mycoplasmoides alvi]
MKTYKKQSKKKIIYIGADHTGVNVKNEIIKYLKNNDYFVKDTIALNSKDNDDYPDFGYAVGSNVVKHKGSIGIAICGTGIGISIAVNKVKGVRGALVYDPKIAELAIKHNNANVLCLGARITDIKTMIQIIDIFLNTKFEKGRHLRRIKKISQIEEQMYESNKK